MYKRANGIYLYLYPKKLQFAAYGQFVLVFTGGPESVPNKLKHWRGLKISYFLLKISKPGRNCVRSKICQPFCAKKCPWIPSESFAALLSCLANLEKTGKACVLSRLLSASIDSPWIRPCSALIRPCSALIRPCSALILVNFPSKSQKPRKERYADG